jgi:uncharacterized protein (TIGR02246 family)
MKFAASLFLSVALTLAATAQKPAPNVLPKAARSALSEDIVASATGSITRAMDASANAWNKGDIRSFMDCYDKSPETTFVGKTVTHGWQQVLDHYLKTYDTADKMGHLDYSDLQVRVLDEQTAVATGHFHLTRPATKNAGSDSGIFSLVFVKTAQGWKIVLDHTSAD